jgi:hypothetical protein
MIHLSVVRSRPLNQDHIKPARSIVDVMASQVLGSQLDQLVLLASMHCVDGTTISIAVPCFDFDEHQHGAVLHH